jgi:Carboxypeptidase regulatory-like domain
MFRRFAITATFVGAAFTILTAQQPQPGPPPGAPGQPPPRTPPRATRPGEDPQKGTAVLRGYVLASDTGNPIRRALVRATSQDGRSGGMTQTDADGRFEIKELLGGRYTLMVTKAGYVSMSYGQRRPEQQGTVLEITDGTMVDKIAFSLPRGGVITGTVLDEFGDPVAGAQVNALRFRYVNGARRLAPSGGGSTDDRGIFRVYGLAPGDYFVSAALRAPQQMMMGPTSVASSPVEGYAPTYYPGTPNPAEATRITVRAAQETSNISLALIATRLSSISGRAVTSSNAPVVQGMVMMMPADRLAGGMMMGMSNTMTRADGTFQLLGVAPGTYNLSLRPRGMPTPDSEFANMRITVGADNLDNVLLVTSRGAIARGIVTTDEGTPPPMRPEQLSLFARPTEPEAMMMAAGDNKVHPDWTFEMTGLSEARLLGGGIAQEPDWSVKAVLHNGIDVTDTPIDFVPGQTVEGFEVVLSRKRTELSGQISGERGAPETDATVVVFSEDPARWGVATRYVRTARPNQDGRYTLRGMPPHDYLVVAVKDLEPGQAQDPEFLDSVRSHAQRVSLGENETRVQDLKIARQ